MMNHLQEAIYILALNKGIDSISGHKNTRVASPVYRVTEGQIN